MRRLTRKRALVVVVVSTLVAATAGSTPSEAGGARPTVPGGATFDVSAAIGGFENPAGMRDDPCEAPFEYSEKWSGPGESAGRGNARKRADGVIEYLWQVACIDPGTHQVSDVRTFWISFPTPEVIVADVAAMLPGYLDPPDVVWPNASPEYGWLFVKVPMDFRVSNLGPVTVTATVSNAIGTATASATATPSIVSFNSGEGGGADCAFEAATEGYEPSSPGSCSYRYVNSSAIAGGEFATTTTVRWDITSTPADPTIPAALETFTNQSLAVSEVQAVVTCQGSGC